MSLKYCAQASHRVREFFQELYLLQVSMQSLISVPPTLSENTDPELAAAFAEVINDPEISVLLSHPDKVTTPTQVISHTMSQNSEDRSEWSRKHSISSMALPAITPVTGTLEFKCKGCDGLLDVFPTGILSSNHVKPIVGGPLTDVPPEYSARNNDQYGKHQHCMTFKLTIYLEFVFA